MALLSEYALTPEVFSEATHQDEELAYLRFSLLRDVLFSEGLVRDLRGGEWRAVFADRNRVWHRRGKELLKKLISQGRLRAYPQMSERIPSTDTNWFDEALASHDQENLDGLITTEAIAELHRGNPIVASIARLPQATWWGQRRNSIRLDRKLENYMQNLSLLLSCSNHLMFIDPYLDPSLPNYQDFEAILRAAVDLRPTVRIEIHRTITEGVGRGRDILTEAEWKARFRDSLSEDLQQKLNAEVFLWDEFHDRYLLSNIAGITLPHGFDTSRRQEDITTWTRLDRGVRDDVMREFDPGCQRHKCQGKFQI
ncbi:MAG: hypothetical protein QM483_11165 [Desulfuromusa sp.]